MARTTHGVRVPVGGTAAALTKTARLLGENDVNILGFSVHGPEGVAYLIPEDAEKSVDVLEDQGIGGDIVTVVEATLPNRPGELARASERLVDAGVEVEASFPTVSPTGPDVRVAVVCEDTGQAAKVLEDLEPDIDHGGTGV